MKTQVRSALERTFDSRVSFDEPLAKHTSLRVGGPADALVRADSVLEVIATVRLCREHGVPLTVLGAGFNTLALDQGVRGVVIRLTGLRRVECVGASRLRAEAGATHTTVTKAAAEAGLSGLEFAVGIPGTIGGWVAMNAGIGAGFEMGDVLAEVEWIAADGAHEKVAASELTFAYRHTELPRGAIVVAATFRLTEDAPERVRSRGDDYLAKRRDSQPIDQRSCGSVFVNPPGDHAGRLIEAAGLKGASAGGARISELHANFIVNTGGASAADVLALIERARRAVHERFDVALESEVVQIGEAP